MILLVLGFAVISLTMLDVFWSTLAGAGGGPLTRRVAHGLWRIALTWHRHRAAHRFLKVMGTVILLMTVGLWIGLLWAGWWLVFSAEPGVVVDAQSKVAVGSWDRVYFTGFTLFTLGTGDLVAQGPGWRVLTALASLNGLFIVTLSITYLLPVVSAANEKRQLADLISALGQTPEAIVIMAWNGEHFDGIESLVADLAARTALHTERHLAYPVLHFFHSRARASAALALARFDEALTLLACGVMPAQRPSQALLSSARSTIGFLLQMLRDEFVNPAGTPPLPDLSALRAQGIPVVEDVAFREALEALAPRRQMLHGYVCADGWSWSDVLYEDSDKDSH